MSDTAITVDNLSKRYIIGHQRDTSDGLRHTIENAFRAPWQWLRRLRERKKLAREEFWALKGVSFEIKQGEVIGIIGRNGAGKSTLLKILSRITDPTEGRIRLQGRVASLLEVGTGFHQELTGRENIYLNGAILGMTRAEIKRKFDEIVAFSEVEKFLDTPVKRYSSGMYVRLAFAVAAHLEPEILIVDEVLAVGDAQFQKKCLGKLGEVAKGGRTVLFVSHNIPAVQALCTKALLLQAGKLKSEGSVERILDEYFSPSASGRSGPAASVIGIGDALELVSFTFQPARIESGKPVRMQLKLRGKRAVTISEMAILFLTPQNTRAAIIDLRSYGFPIRLSVAEEWGIDGEIESVPFVEGEYNVGIYYGLGNINANVHDLNCITVQCRPGTAGIAPYPVAYRGVVELNFSPNVVEEPAKGAGYPVNHFV